MAAKKDQTEIKRTRQEWIQSAEYLKAERFEIAGALFDVKETDLIAEEEMKRRLIQYRGGSGE